MKVSQIILTSLAVAVSSTAAIKIATGEHIYKDANYAVAWKEGQDPCRNDHELAPVYANPCDCPFVIDSELRESASYSTDISDLYSIAHLAYCGTNNFGLYKNDGSRVGGCPRS